MVIPAEQKKPCIRGYLRTDVAHSAQFALASLDTKAFFPCGRGSRLTLFDKTRKALLVMKTSDPTTFVANSPKAEVVTLARK